MTSSNKLYLISLIVLTVYLSYLLRLSGTAPATFSSPTSSTSLKGSPPSDFRWPGRGIWSWEFSWRNSQHWGSLNLSLLHLAFWHEDNILIRVRGEDHLGLKFCGGFWKSVFWWRALENLNYVLMNSQRMKIKFIIWIDCFSANMGLIILWAIVASTTSLATTGKWNPPFHIFLIVCCA